jgi:hypothetical protein
VLVAPYIHASIVMESTRMPIGDVLPLFERG